MKSCVGFTCGVIALQLQGCWNDSAKDSTNSSQAAGSEIPAVPQSQDKKQIETDLVAELMKKDPKQLDVIMKVNAKINGEVPGNRPPMKGNQELNRQWFRLNLIKTALIDVYNRREELQKQHNDKDGNMVWMLQLQLVMEFMEKWDLILFDNQTLTDMGAFMINDPRFDKHVVKSPVEKKIMNPESSWDQIYQILSMFPTNASMGTGILLGIRNPAIEACMVFMPHIPADQQQAFLNGLELNVGSGLGSDTDELKFDKAMAAELLKQDLNHDKLNVANADIDDVTFTRDMVRVVQERVASKKYGHWNCPAHEFKQKLTGGGIVSKDFQTWMGRQEL